MKTARAILVLPMLLLGVIPASGAGYPGEKAALLHSAQKLEKKAYDVLEEAVTEHRFFTRGQEAGLDAIRELAWVSSYFHEQVRLDQNLYRTVADFEILAEAFYRAEWWMNRVPVDRDVHKEFRKLGSTFEQLRRHYSRTVRGYERTGHRRMDDTRSHEVLRTRVIPRVQRRPTDGRPHNRVYLDLGPRFAGGRVRVVWR
jgi:hypothetical protein